MGNKSKEKRKARKRQLSNSKTNEDLEVIEVSLQKKRLLDDSFTNDQAGKYESEEEDKLEILPTRELLESQLVAAVRNHHLAIIEGPLGCGKTFLARYASKTLCLPLHIMQMGDEIDSKTLFGSYHCTEVAGQFIWRESSFAKWLQAPGIILLEDIDTANADVISKILDIATHRQNDPSNTDKNSHFHNDARIIATMSGKGKKVSVLDGVPVRIRVEQLTEDELKRLASKAFPRIAHLARTLINTFRKIENVPGTGNSRQLTSTDFLRGCARLALLPDISANVESFAELIDVWCLADQKQRSSQLCSIVASSLNVNPDRVHTHLSVRQPEVKYDESVVSIGRTSLPRKISMIKTGRHKLGHTRDVVQLMERVVVCVSHNEPLLLVGETGVGKTSVVQAVADLIGVTLDVVNVSPTSDSDELIQGYKPITIGRLMEPFTKFYIEVFTENFDVKNNQKFIDNLEKCLSSGRFKDYLSLVEATANKALQRKTKNKDERWAELLVRAKKIRDGIEKGAAPFALQKGAVLEAAEKGHWLLVDEINLAPPECLDAIVHALSASGTHPNFRLFACMNPATDAGKRRLPPGVRSRFTEFFVSETSDPFQLALIVSAYLPTVSQQFVENLVNFYLSAKQLYPSSYSLRTLCRALLFTSDNMFGSLEQSVYEAVSMAFLTNLEKEEKGVMQAKIRSVFRCKVGLMPVPKESHRYINIGGYYLERGVLLPESDSKYVITKTVKINLAEIARIVCSGRFPILLEGETSAGKTSIVCHLAKATGNRIVRINNHEHTDVQEYMGSYVADSGGRLVFREGALVQAVRDGSWVILDELNLAPTDVIEALNRLLDDNRELFVPEINETIKAHPRFRLFATQNPAGSYAGRKRLSRALMSRFIVLRFNHLPIDELSEMVCARCQVPPNAALKMIEVLNELRTRRSLSGLFSARDGLMTLRDVFRWAKRMTTDETTDDWLQVLVNHGFFLLAGRCRSEKDEVTVVETLEKVIKRKIDKNFLFSLNSPYMPTDVTTENVVLTLGMRRMLVMTEQAWIRDEAVLMVGETGGGKTTLSEVVGRGKLRSINCHERTETADLLGRLRPKHDGGFEWSDGVVISAMRDGAPLLVDEISLAEDSVLERLNPLFEEGRSLLLSDAGTEAEIVESKPGFQMIATMNPGGDYGKKELSKALKNRFTEVWTSNDYTSSELVTIFDQRLARVDATKEEARISPTRTAISIVSWITVFFGKYSHVFRHAPSVRDIVACAELYASAVRADIDRPTAIKDALCAVFLDSLAGLTTRLHIDPIEVFKDALDMLHKELVKNELLSQFSDVREFTQDTMNAVIIDQSSDHLKVGELKIIFGPATPVFPKGFSLTAPTCTENLHRIARGLLIKKPILLEGAPGCGKSSTVMALAQLTGNPITRLNLSDQTDLSDLFGSDVPFLTEDGTMTFRWEDGPVLKAIKKGEWILLDEMNLASQAVLEGLNACFDHRRVLYIAELNREFEIPATSNCRFFACQNPRVQGGNRRALPKSFINRFTNIYTNDLSKTDVEIILKEVDKKHILTDEQRNGMVTISEKCEAESEKGIFLGGPFSFNLRDLLRWYDLLKAGRSLGDGFDMVYMARTRRDEDKELMRSIYEKTMNERLVGKSLMLTVDEKEMRIGKCTLNRSSQSAIPSNRRLLASQIVPMHQIATCVELNWLTLLVGPRNCGKRATVENVANVCGRKLKSIALNADTDAQELIGSYEQVVDENCFPDAKAKIIEILKQNNANEDSIKRVQDTEDLIKLEGSVEWILAETGNIEEIRDILSSANQSSMRFEWTDSVFVDAYLHGDWLLIEDVNLCSAAVLDRLNSCLEAGGKLVVAERQNSFEPLEPHPDFRVFLSMDSKVGEISRAMRNRSVEIYFEENTRWNTSPDDVRTVIGTKVTTEWSKAASCDLTAEQQLHLAALLEDDNELFSPEVAWKLIGGRNRDYMEEDMDDDEIILQSSILSPRIQDISELNGIYEKYVVATWQRAAVNTKTASVEAIPMTFLSASPWMISNLVEEFKLFFGSPVVDAIIKRIPIDILEPNKRHLVDPEFSSASASSSGVKFSRAILFEWILQMISKIPVDQNSADHLSSTMTKYEMATCDVTFTNLAEISSLVRFIVEMFKSSTPLSKKPSREVCISISYLLLVAASRRKLTARTGCAAIYLAWNDLKNELSNIRGFACPKNLSSISEKINEGWSSESYETFVTEYIHRWKKFAICQPFTDENQSRLFVETIEKVLGEETVETDVEMTDESMEDDDETKKRLIAVSPIELSTKVVESVETLFEFLTTGVADLENEIFKKTNVYSGVEWKDHKYSRWIRTAAVFCSCIASGKLSEEETEDQNILVSDLASVGGGAHSIATRLFFSTIHYNPTMSNLSIAHLQKFPIKELGSKLWRLAVNSSSIHKTMRNVLKQLGIGLEGWTSGSTNGMACGIEMMEKSLPPKETLDPVIFEEERVLFVKAKRRIVERQLKYLAEWRILMGRQPTECDYSSSQVIIKGLNTLKEELSQLENEDQDHCSVVYRQSATQYNQLCAEMRSFLDVSKSAISDARNSEGEFNDKTMIIRLARVKSFAMSAENFRISILRKFVSFVDVSMPFIAGLLIIEIAFNEIALKWRQEAKKLHAQTSSAFPRILQTKASSSGLVSNEMLNWASRDGSPMPLHLKAAVVRRKLTEIEHFDSSSITEIQWTRAQWKKWYEKNIAKAEQKDFVYRTKTEEEKDELDIEEFFANLEQDSQVLPDSDVSMLLEAVEKKKFSLIDEKSRKQSDERYEMALVWMRYVMSEVGAIPAKNSVWSQCVDGDQKLFEILAAHEGLSDDDNGEDTRIIDVYRNSSLRECRRVAVILERLSTRTRQVLERWPEVVALKTIISTIEEFFSVSVSTPHIKIATQIENLIEVCEQWEMMADRANSLREPLGDLRKLLVDWKKMEVRCWSSLLVNCENEAKQRAQLVSFPLFESLFEATTPEMESAIIPMSIEWMHNSTLIDFATRVRSVESLSKWAKIAGKEVLAIQLEAASRHFGMLIERVDQRLKDAREPAEKCLKDYLKVVKYNDLNLWNIRVSSTKAHAQLYKIVRRFKDSINEELHDDFGILQAVDEWKRRVFELSTDCVIEKDLVGEELEKRIRQVKKFSNEITDKVSILCETSAIEELHEQTKAADEAIRTMINYTGEDEEKEKQQGYARNSRQRLVAMMIKECQAVGLNARKAILLEQETINRQSIIEVLSGEECEKEMRICASGRNIVIQKSNKIDQQVGVSTRKHLSGMIEYGMAYMLSLQKNIGNWKSQISKIRKHSQTLKVICENQRDVWIVDHGLISERVSKMVELISTIEVLVGSIKHRIDLIPETCEEKIRLKTHLHPLSKLSKSDETAKKLTDWAEKLSTLTSNLKRTNERLAEFSVFKSTDFIVWRTQLNGDSQELLADLGMFDGYFETEKEQITEALKEISIWTKHVDSCETAEEAETDVTSLLLLVQTIYKKLEGVTRGEEDKALDQINILVDILEQCNIESVTNSLASVVEQCSHGGMIIKQLEGLVELSNITVGIIEMSLVQLTNCLGYFCVFYHSMLSMTMQLYEKGYVNTIPKAEKQESGDGQTDDSGEGGGIGEGGTAKDAKDVTEEMEETGQIEGLEDEQPADSEEHEAKNDNEKPIDMEDDFAEDLQDIDKNEKGDQEDGEDQSDEEPEVEDQMGDVEEEDDKQLDPKMWDEEEKDQEQQKNMDQEQQAADDQTDEMVAKEDDAQTKDQDQEKEGQEDNEQEEKEEQENMDERDRENDDRDENHMDTSEPNNDEENIEKGEIDEIEDGDDGDETDKEDEDAIEGEGEEEQNENQEQEEIDESKQVNEEESEEKMDDEALEQGTGGEKNDQDDNKDVAEGGLAEEDEKEDQEDKDEKGDGKSKSDPNGDGSKGEAPKEQTEKEEIEKDENEEKTERKRELATDDALMEEAEMGEGEENETGQQMENAEISDRQMVGKGTIEEARQTKREEKREEEKKKRRELKDALEGEAGEEGGEVEDGNADEAKEAHIHMAAHEMFTVMKEEQNELVVGITDDQENQSADGSEEVEHSRMNDKADEQWAAMSRTVGMLAAELAENLRLILEPQRANKMQGDYRSGKRLNMRRLIPYIASEYRKDRIWMRRTKRAQREYQILIAVDDSESMNENGIHQSTCESVCIVEDALRRCDAGRVSVCSFGADVKTIVPFGEASASSSIEMLKQMTFSQKKTDLLSLLKTAKHQLNEIRTPTSEQMLIVISDGRGALSQGADKVRALYSDLQGVTVLFIILDSGKKSIEDHTVASFTDNKVVLTPYLALFPFPFYALVKSVQQLPTIIAESIRQWFEMTMQHS